MNGDADTMVEAVLDVLAPKLAGPPGYQPVRWPVVRFDHEGQAVVPDDMQIRALAEAVVTAVRSCTAPVWQTRPDGTEERPVRGGLTAVMSPSRDHGWVWAIVDRTEHSTHVRATAYADDKPMAAAMVAGWEQASTC